MIRWENLNHSEGVKQCPVCKEDKVFGCYYHKSGTKDGRQTVCKACYNERLRKQNPVRFDRNYRNLKYET